MKSNFSQKRNFKYVFVILRQKLNFCHMLLFLPYKSNYIGDKNLISIGVPCILLLRKTSVFGPKYSFSFRFHFYMSQQRSPAGRTTLWSVVGQCRSVPLPYLFVCFLPFKVFLIILHLYSLKSNELYAYVLTQNKPVKKIAQNIKSCIMCHSVKLLKIF